MMIITSFCVLAMIARTLAANEDMCCPAGNFMKIEENKAACFTIGSNETSPTNYCEFVISTALHSDFIFNEDGTVDINGTSHKGAGRYCFNDITDYPRSNRTLKLGIICANVELKIDGYVLIISVVFLTLTVIIYSTLIEIRDLFSKSFINLCGSLAVGLCLLAILHLMDVSDEDETNRSSVCAARGYFAYYFLLVSFFWTTAISTQLLLSIRSPSSVQDCGWKNFAWYALFAWGCPIVITICMVIVDFYPGDHAKPDIGTYTCWFNPYETKHTWYWLFSVLATLMSINILMYIYISQFFCRNHFASSQVSTIKYRFGLALKLFAAMGLFWIIEMLALAIEYSPNVYWIIVRVVTGLQGLWMFLVWVVFRKRVVQALHNRSWLPCISGLVERRLANCDEADDDIVQHTAVTMSER